VVRVRHGNDDEEAARKIAREESVVVFLLSRRACISSARTLSTLLLIRLERARFYTVECWLIWERGKQDGVVLF
jgi:hypothetical protein